MKEFLTVPIRHWDPEKTIECGQIFHWYRKDDAYILVHGEETLRVKTQGDQVIFYGETQHPDDWHRFLGLTKTQDVSRYAKDPSLSAALEFSQGLRLLQQEPFVTIMSFIVSANNHFARIRGGIHAMAARWGSEIEEDVHAFPAPEALASVSAAALREFAGVGYRDRYIAETAKLVAGGEWDLQAPYAMTTEEARKYILQLPGVGPKVADCILLFAYGKGDTFPVDVWMHRVMLHLNPKGPARRDHMSREAIVRFGEDAGLLQQMLFYYAKEKKLGTEKKKKDPCN